MRTINFKIVDIEAPFNEAFLYCHNLCLSVDDEINKLLKMQSGTEKLQISGEMHNYVINSLKELYENRDKIRNKISGIMMKHNQPYNIQLFERQIVNLTPLNNLACLREAGNNLNSLELCFNHIIDLLPLSNLTNLRYLNLGFNQIIDLSPLSNLTNLEVLELSDNQIIDLSLLSNLTNLKELRLRKNKIIDITPLANLTNLYTLRLSDNMITDMTLLGNLKTNLKNIDFSYNLMTNLNKK